MPILSTIGNKTWSQRCFVWFLYGALSIFGASMAVPFMIMLTSSTSNAFDYDRYSIVPRSLWSDADRFMKGLPFFREAGRVPLFPEAPVQWTSWRTIGLDNKGAERVARSYLDADDRQLAFWRVQAADYSDFALSHPLDDTKAKFTAENASTFILQRYVKLATDLDPPVASLSRKEKEKAALALLSTSWGVPFTNYISIRFDRERGFPIAQQSWAPPPSEKWTDYNAMRFAIQHGVFTPGVLSAWRDFLAKHDYPDADIDRLTPLPVDASTKDKELWREFARVDAPLSPVMPFSLGPVWQAYLSSDEIRGMLKLAADERFDIARYNKLAGTNYARLEDTPFPLPAEGFVGLQPIWRGFVETQYPLRLLQLEVTPDLQARFAKFLAATYGKIGALNQLLGTDYHDWAQVPLAATMPPARLHDVPGIRQVWASFVKGLPAAERHPTSADASYQALLKARYGTLDALNAAYGWKLAHWEEAQMPVDKAYAVTYANHKLAIALEPALFNYRTILSFLVDQGNSIPVTLWLIILSITSSLTVNPIAGYALSRFNLKRKDKIILFCLATSAFPAMVSAIPGYLLMRDLGLLNTFFALILPGAASGMGIFILKGFFDSLPQELYEAATIDGAREWQIFFFVTIPMVTPILAINALHAFIAAYDGWAWALLICQDKSMWTLSVWLYQANSWWAGSPWITTAGFVVTSIPTLIVFLFCQKIIMRGIIVPSMK